MKGDELIFGQNDPNEDGENYLSVWTLPDSVAERMLLAMMLLLADLMAALERTGVAEITHNGVTYRLKDLQDLGDGRFYWRFEIETLRKRRKR